MNGEPIFRLGVLYKESAFTYLCEKIIVDFHAPICKKLGEMGGRADEKIITNCICYHPLIHVFIFHILPVRVLKKINI